MIEPAIGHVHSGCLCCGSKPVMADLNWQPHPGFGMLDLTRDGERPEWWTEFCGIVRWVYYIDKGWTTLTTVKGDEVEYFDGDWHPEWAVESVTLREIEECVAEDPDHDWRLRVEGPLYGVVYQRHNPKVWVAIERLDGFA